MKKIISIILVIFFIYSCGKRGSLEYPTQDGGGYFIESINS